ALDLAPIWRRVAAPGGRIIGTAELGQFAISVLDCLAACDEIGVAQTDLPARRQSEEFLGRVLHEIIPLHKNLSAKQNAARASGRVFRIIDSVELLGLRFR